MNDYQLKYKKISDLETACEIIAELLGVIRLGHVTGEGLSKAWCAELDKKYSKKAAGIEVVTIDGN